jgi:hypothetical protein
MLRKGGQGRDQRHSSPMGEEHQDHPLQRAENRGQVNPILGGRLFSVNHNACFYVSITLGIDLILSYVETDLRAPQGQGDGCQDFT